VEIAASAKSFDEVVKRTGLKPETVRKAALRLGVRLNCWRRCTGRRLAVADEFDPLTVCRTRSNCALAARWPHTGSIV
jgi:hypothetical protein